MVSQPLLLCSDLLTSLYEDPPRGIQVLIFITSMDASGCEIPLSQVLTMRDVGTFGGPDGAHYTHVPV